MNKLILFSVLPFTLVGCLGTESEDSASDPSYIAGVIDDYDASVATGIDVANISRGAVAYSAYNSSTAKNLIDGSSYYKWISSPDVPIEITLSKKYQISRIEIDKDHEGIKDYASYDPDLILEISDDGVNYKTLSVTNMVADVECYESSFYSIHLECSFEPAQTISHIRMMSSNGKSFLFHELKAYTE